MRKDDVVLSRTLHVADLDAAAKAGNAHGYAEPVFATADGDVVAVLDTSATPREGGDNRIGRQQSGGMGGLGDAHAGGCLLGRQRA